MDKILFYLHGGNVNRGCEAIITSTSKLIKEVNKSSNINIATQYFDSDIKRNIKNIDRYIAAEHIPGRVSPERVYRFALRKLRLKKQNIKSVYKNTIKEIKKSDICFVIGGDTYFKNYGMVDTLYSLNSVARQHGKRNVLWCCSIEKNEINDEMKKDLLGFDLIVARESITLNNLKDKGISKNVVMYPDPAFTMELEKVPMPKGWVNGNTIIINTSPLITKFATSSNLIIESIQNLIDYIIESTKYSVALLPHVDCDVVTNTTIFNKYNSNKRVINIPFGYSATQLKYIISKAEMLIGARTHATIAAYSTCVPTLVIGYSVKSLGIARDIFGSEKGLVIPVSKINSKEELFDEFIVFMKNKNLIKAYLKNVMPAYIKKANNLKVELENLLGEREI